ncbi:sugar transporter [Kaistia sp. 32K]|nr:sugar transporter [Kaistia sp. 32K]
MAAVAAAIVLVIGMGFGRFAFTGLYPQMVADGQISVGGGSYAASANYAGYLIGALLVSFLTGISARRQCSIAVGATVAALGLLWLPLPEGAVIAVRGFAGVASAIALVAASHWLIHDRQHHHGAPALFSGVGIGIFLSAEIIALGHFATLSSRAIWLLLGLVGLGLAVVALAMQARTDRTKPAPAERGHAGAQARDIAFGPARLIVVYGLAGFGYIITATYLPLLVQTALGSVDPVHIWAVFGLGAVPSCFLWHALHVRWGTSRALLVNLLVQAAGVILPVLHLPSAYIASALLVGGTFMGTVTIAMPAARRVAGKVRFNMLAIMTASYGVGQIVGPLIAALILARTGSFDPSLMLAGGALVVAAVLCVSGRRVGVAAGQPA